MIDDKLKGSGFPCLAKEEIQDKEQERIAKLIKGKSPKEVARMLVNGDLRKKQV